MNAYSLRAFLVFLASALFSSAVPGESPWQRHFPVLPHDHYQSLATDGTLFAAVGELGNIFNSPDGEAWTLVHPGDGRKLRHAAHGGGTWAAAGDGMILISGDGESWAAGFEEEGAVIEGIAWSGDRWVAVGRRETESGMVGVALASGSGTDWTTEAEFPGLELRAVAFGGSPAVGLLTAWDEAGQTGKVFRMGASLDWEESPGAPVNDLRVVRWTGDRFMAAGRGGSAFFHEAGSGEWSDVQVVTTDALILDLAVNGDLVVAVGERRAAPSGDYIGPLQSLSLDGGVTWSRDSLHQRFPPMRGAVASGESVVAAGDWQTVRRIETDGTWNLLAGEDASPISGLAFGNGRYVAVSGLPAPYRRLFIWPFRSLGSENSRTLVSEDLASWSVEEVDGGRSLFDIAFGAGRFVAVGADGVILHSTDGKSWEEAASPVSHHLLRVIWAGDLFVAGGYNTVIYSSDGLEWQIATLPGLHSNHRILDITWNGEEYFFTGGTGTQPVSKLFFRSKDLSTWQSLNFVPFESFSRRLWGVAAGPSGVQAIGIKTLSSTESILARSRDSRRWKYRETPLPGPVSGAAWHRGWYVASGYQPELAIRQETSYWRFTDNSFPVEWEDHAPPPLIWRFREVNGRLFGMGDGFTLASMELSDTPFFIEHPRKAVVSPGESAFFSVSIENPSGEEVSVQWFFEDEPLADSGGVSGSATPELRIDAAELADAGPYSALVTNSTGSTRSAPADLVVRRPIEVAKGNHPGTPGWEVDRFAAIQPAIDSVEAGGFAHVTVQPGVYQENISFNGRNILLTSEDPGNSEVVAATIIDGGGNGSVVRFENGEGEHAILRGMTIRNGLALRGGGVFIDEAYPRIEQNRIVNNLVEADGSTSASGGGLYFNAPFYSQGKLVLLGNLMEGNSAVPSDLWSSSGGGVYLLVRNVSDVLMENNTLRQNSASVGGGINLYSNELGSQRVEFRNNWLRENQATGGGGFNVRLMEGVTVFEDNLIEYNEAFSGAGMRIIDHLPFPGHPDPLPHLEIQRCRFWGNQADIGGALHFLGDFHHVIENNLFAFNTASQSGGAGYFAPRWISMVFNQTTVYGNEAPNGAAVFLVRGDLTFANSILAGNQGGEFLSPGVSLTYSNIWGNGDPFEGKVDGRAGLAGNISLDPLFADADGGDFRLRSRAGRWDPAADGGHGDWVVDADHSPSIAAGMPGENGVRPNQGAHGLTATASHPLEAPLVSLAALPPGELDKGTGQAAHAVLSRSGSLDGELPVDLLLNGSAEAGVDFTVGDGWTTLAAGEAVKRVELVPVTNAGVRGDRQIHLGILPGPAYETGAEAAVVFPIWDTAYHAWLAERLPEEAWGDSGQTDPLAMPDGSGRSNLVRFGFAVEEDASSDRLPAVGIHSMDVEGTGPADYLTLTFAQPVRRAGLDYLPETSTDLLHWQPVELIEVERALLPGGTVERVVLREAEPLDANSGPRFLRVRLELAGY